MSCEDIGIRQVLVAVPRLCRMTPVPEILNFVGGTRLEGRSAFTNVSPTDGTSLATVHEADPRVVTPRVPGHGGDLGGPWGGPPAPNGPGRLGAWAAGSEDDSEGW